MRPSALLYLSYKRRFLQIDLCGSNARTDRTLFLDRVPPALETQVLRLPEA
ncbi:MAG: hypothetical protein ACERKX_00190 [Anaerolineales bacterium]